MKLYASALLTLTALASYVAAAAAPREPGPARVQRHSHSARTARHAGVRGRHSADIEAFIRALRARGLKVEDAGAVSQPFFTPKGRALTVAGENVQVFRYPSVRAASAEAKRVGAEGTSVGTSSAMWTGPPHFYRKGRLIVLYVGENADVLKTLTSVLGPQFAGK